MLFLKQSFRLILLLFGIILVSNLKADNASDHYKLSNGRMLVMSISGIGGSIVGVGIIGLPFLNYYANNIGNYDAAAPTIVFLSSWIMGNALGVYFAGNHKSEKKGRFLPTLLGSTSGIISGPLSVVGIPIGGILGFRYSLRNINEEQNGLSNIILNFSKEKVYQSNLRVPIAFKKTFLFSAKQEPYIFNWR